MKISERDDRPAVRATKNPRRVAPRGGGCLWLVPFAQEGGDVQVFEAAAFGRVAGWRRGRVVGRLHGGWRYRGGGYAGQLWLRGLAVGWL